MNLSTVLLALGFITLFALDSQSQETSDDYSDYSYLWEKDKKKKKKKKDIEKIDTLQNATDSLLLTTDNPQISDFRQAMVLPSDGGSINGGMTYTQIDGKEYVGLLLSPEFKFGKVGVGLNIPILYGLDDKSVRTEIFEDGVGVARLIQYVRYGVQKRDPVYVKAGNISRLMLGYGGLMNNYTNSTSYEKSKVGIHADVNYNRFIGLELLYSDLNPQSFNLFAARPYIRPFSSLPVKVLNTMEVGGSFFSDMDQTDIITSDSTSSTYAFTKSGAQAFGLDMGITLLSSPFIQIDLFASYSMLNIQSDSLTQLATSRGVSDFKTGSGVSVGMNFRMHFIADVFSTDIRIEHLNNSDHYIPQFFNGLYESNKDERIASLITAEGINGIYGSLRGHIMKKVSLGGSLIVPDDISESSPAFVEVFADMERLGNKFSLHGSYMKGNLDDLGDAFGFDEKSLAKMRFIYHVNKFLATGVDYYWLYTPTAEGGYKPTKYVMPYVGVSIAL